MWLTAALAMLGAVALSLVHPLSPVLVLGVFYATLVLLCMLPRLWLFLLPAALPVLNFMPWSGRLMVEEFDLLLLCVLVAGYGRMAWEKSRAAAPAVQASHHPGAGGGLNILVTLLALFSLASAVRGLSANGFDNAIAQIREFGLSQDYADPLNSLRLLKSLAFAVLCIPLLQRELGNSARQTRAFNGFARGVLTGLAMVVAVVVWERLAYPGLLNFSTRYRTTAMFWEMHVGGAALDAYFALTVPFVAWALARAKKLRHWLSLALLALLTCYAVLTTFSRGVFVAVALPLILLALGRWAQKSGLDWRHPLNQAWRRRAGFGLWLVLGLEVALVVTGGSFLMDRMAQSESDLDERLAHWRRGAGLLESPTDWLLGKGLGRFPAEYASLGKDTEFSGTLRLMREPASEIQGQTPAPLAAPRVYARLGGPLANPENGGLFMLNQRVNVAVADWLQQTQKKRETRPFIVNLVARAALDTQVMVKVCEKHLLYEGDCLVRYLTLRNTHGAWQTVSVPLRGGAIRTDQAAVIRAAVLSITVFTPGANFDIRRFQLTDPAGRALVANADFSNGLAHWFPSAGSYYLPWHIDNLYLELLIERGLAGLVLFALILGAAGARLVAAPHADRPQLAIVAAAIFGALLLGLVSSVLDTPRVAFLLFFLIFLGIALTSAKSPP